MAQYASINDRPKDLWLKIATNWYNHAIDLGLTGFNPPSWNDDVFDLIKKTTYYTARIAAS